MPVTIGEINVQTEQPPAPTPAQPAGSGMPRIDPDQLRMIMRREQDRRARLWVD
jgi:hypothetical protein